MRQQIPAPEGAPKPQRFSVLSKFCPARPGSGHPVPKLGISKGHPLRITGAAVLTSERQPRTEEASLAPGLMWVG